MKYLSPAEQQKQDDLKFYCKTRESNECSCGRGKQPRMWFCFQCYKSLPVDMQRALWNPITKEAIEAYEKALKYLGD